MTIVKERQVTSFRVDRIIRTDFYFDFATIHPDHHQGHGPTLSVAWLNRPSNLHSPPAVDFLEIPEVEAVPAEKMLECLLNFSGYLPNDRAILSHFIASSRHDPPAPFIQELLNETIIIERSPPIAETLGHIFHSATSTSLGVLIGAQLSPSPLLMLATIPAGIVLMGAAFGISKGLERGLSKRIENSIVATAAAIPRAPVVRKKRSRSNKSKAQRRR